MGSLNAALVDRSVIFVGPRMRVRPLQPLEWFHATRCGHQAVALTQALNEEDAHS